MMLPWLIAVSISTMVDVLFIVVNPSIVFDKVNRMKKLLPESSFNDQLECQKGHYQELKSMLFNVITILQLLYQALDFPSVCTILTDVFIWTSIVSNGVHQ